MRSTETAVKECIFEVTGLDCDDEVRAVRNALLSLSCVKSADPNLINSKVRIVYEGDVPDHLFIQKIESAGLKLAREKKRDPSEASGLSKRAMIVALEGVLLGVALLLDRFWTTSELMVRLLCLISVFVGAQLVVPKAFRAVKELRLDMNVLMTVAVMGAIGIGQYIEASAVVFLFSLAEYLESFSLARARRSVQSLLKLVPETALVRGPSGETVESPVSEVPVGAVIFVRSGERIPLDGVIERGRSNVNQAPITGESIPVERGGGDSVLAGTINGEGSLDVRVTQSYRDTKIAQIINLIEDAQSKKAPTQKFVDIFASYYTPVVFVFAMGILLIPPLLLGGEWLIWIYRALVLLVIACPCALVIATPVSIVSGLTAMARRGILIKGGGGLEAIGKLKALAVDKTGTITEGVPKVIRIHSMNGFNEYEILTIAASIDTHSTHPLAQSVVSAAKEAGLEIKASIDYCAMNGRGAEAVIDGHIYFVGNHRYAHENAICSEALELKLESIEDRARSVVVVGHRPHSGCSGEILGVLELGDAVRSDAEEAIQSLHEAGIRSVVMLSGDNQRTVDAVSKQVGIDEAYGDLLPGEKVLKIEALRDRFGTVAMIGDGVNDAPAMATATLGIAMGASGTDTAIETADVTLMQDRLTGVADAVRMGRRTLRVIWFNTGFALVTKLIFLGLSATGHSALWLAIAADTGVTLLVIANALRLLGKR